MIPSVQHPGELVRAKASPPYRVGFRVIGRRNADTRLEINRVHNSARRLDVGLDPIWPDLSL